VQSGGVNSLGQACCPTPPRGPAACQRPTLVDLAQDPGVAARRA
jgi:hypothetical protein